MTEAFPSDSHALLPYLAFTYYQVICSMYTYLELFFFVT